MDTSESLKSDTPQSSANKEQNSQKEQVDNNISGMYTVLSWLSLFIFF